MHGSDDIGISLHIKTGADYKYWYSTVQTSFTDPFYSNAGFSRFEVPVDIIETYFNTECLENMKVYSRDNEYLGDGKFIRYEVAFDTHNSYQLAVYKLNRVAEGEAEYAIGGLQNVIPKITKSNSSNRQIYNLAETETLAGHYKLESERQFNFMDGIYTAISGYDTTTFEGVLNFFETRENKTKSIISFGMSESFGAIQSVPIRYHGAPIFLISLGSIGGHSYSCDLYVKTDGKYFRSLLGGRIKEK